MINSIGSPLLWGSFAVIVVIMLAVDLLLQGRRGATTMTLRQAAIWSLVWVSLSLLLRRSVVVSQRNHGARRCRQTGAGVLNRLSH